MNKFEWCCHWGLYVGVLITALGSFVYLFKEETTINTIYMVNGLTYSVIMLRLFDIENKLK